MVMENDLNKNMSRRFHRQSAVAFVADRQRDESLPKTSAIIPIGITNIATRQSAIANDMRK